MSRSLIEFGHIADLEDNIRQIPRIASVLTTLGTGNDALSVEGCYALGSYLRLLGKELEAQFDSLCVLAREGRQ